MLNCKPQRHFVRLHEIFLGAWQNISDCRPGNENGPLAGNSLGFMGHANALFTSIEQIKHQPCRPMDGDTYLFSASPPSSLWTFYLWLSPPSQLQCFWVEPSPFPFCSEKSILGGGLKDLSQEYYSTAWRSDKPPVTSSRDGAGQACTPHLGGRHSPLAAGKSAIKGKTWITSLLVRAISNLRAPDLWLSPVLIPTQTLTGWVGGNVHKKTQFMTLRSFVMHSVIKWIMHWFCTCFC